MSFIQICLDGSKRRRTAKKPLSRAFSKCNACTELVVDDKHLVILVLILFNPNLSKDWHSGKEHNGKASFSAASASETASMFSRFSDDFHCEHPYSSGAVNDLNVVQSSPQSGITGLPPKKRKHDNRTNHSPKLPRNSQLKPLPFLKTDQRCPVYSTAMEVI